MTIQPAGAYMASPLHGDTSRPRQNFASAAATSATTEANVADTATISQAARDALSASAGGENATINARLAAIKAEGPLTRTAEDMDYLYAHDAKLAAIRDKANRSPGSLTSSEIDYQQKTIGFVNTMALLSPAERTMYDDMVASGNTAAAAGMAQVAFIRTMGHTAGGAGGSSYDPINTEITPQNIVNYFRHSIVDTIGKSDTQFQALIEYLENQPGHPGAASVGA